jgi:voltage-gated potassium channel
MPTRVSALFNVPLLRRVAFHARRIGQQVDRHFFITLLTAIGGFVVVATLLVALFEDKFTIGGIGNTLYWAVTTVIGSGDASYVTSLGGFIVAWLLAFFGVAIVAAMTGAVVGFLPRFPDRAGRGADPGPVGPGRQLPDRSLLCLCRPPHPVRLARGGA